MNKLDSFFLVGHSFGGYVAGHFAVRNPDYVKKLILVSPVGLRVAPDGESWE